MILFKTIALQYGRFLETGEPGGEYDLVGQTAPTPEAQMVRQVIVQELTRAQKYLLDHRAANYLDTLRMDVQGMPGDHLPEEGLRKVLREVDLPRECIWVEYDSRQLWRDRIDRGLSTVSELSLAEHGQRGFLLDNRAATSLTVLLFNALSDRGFMDPPIKLVLSKSQDGRPDFDNARWEPMESTLTAFVRAGFVTSQQQLGEMVEEQKGHITYEMVIAFMLFAALASREDDLVSEEVPSLTAAQVKTARKFGRNWVTETLRSHITIRIGPKGERHLSEHSERRRFEAAISSGRSAPIEHWVSEHERHYSNGKVVRIAAHKRGRRTDSDVPIRVVGPRDHVK